MAVSNAGASNVGASSESAVLVPGPWAAATTAVATANATPSTAAERVQLMREAMGTRVVLAAYTTDSVDQAGVRKALEDAHAEIKRLELLMTPWLEDSELSRVNAAAGKSAVVVGEETFEVIKKSLWISEHSDGVFDITFASMGKLWRFDRDCRDEMGCEEELVAMPDPAAIDKARRRIDYRQIVLDEQARSVMLKRADQKINLGGIAKGYAIDRAADVLRAAGLAAFFAQAGGDLYVEGRKPNGQPWTVGVRDPRGPDGSYFAVLPVEDHAFSTAGDYERSFIVDGKRYHHIIDPRTGYPATASRSVTVWAKDALTADAIDDAVFILGPERGLQLVESIPDCGAVIVDASNKVWISKRLEGRVHVKRAPSEGL